MRKFGAVLVLLTAIALLALAAIPAFAQDADGIPVGSLFGAFRPYLIELASVLILAVTGWIARTAQVKWGLDIEAQHREAFQTALTNAAGYVIAQAGGRVEAMKLDVGSPAIQSAATMVIHAVPDALSFFGVTPTMVAERVKAKLGIAAPE